MVCSSKTAAFSPSFAVAALVALYGMMDFPLLAQSQPFSDCDPAIYYQGLPSSTASWTKDDLRELVTRTHRNRLPNIANVTEQDDIFAALKDLWPGEPNEDGDPQVRLIYRNSDMNANSANLAEGWRREHLWPDSRGLPRGHEAFTDVHVKAAADSTVQIAKGSLFFGTCGTVEDEDSCITPANDETAPDTAQDRKIWTPPLEYRGDIARAIFYNQLRYETELGLELSDCPPFDETQFGYLSALLQWNLDDPPSEEEMNRTMRACERWQGNRNVFVDYHELIREFWGEPDFIAEGTYSYNSCLEIPTAQPTATLNECSYVAPGDLFFRVFNTENDDEFILFALDDIPPEVENIYVTDKAWNGSEFMEGEGILKYEIGPDGIERGADIGYGREFVSREDKDRWEEVEGPDNEFFDLGIAGDNMFVYCINADGFPHFIAGLIYNSEETWQAVGENATFGANETVLPQVLENATAAVALPVNLSYFFQTPPGSGEVQKPTLLGYYTDPDNWVGSMIRLTLPSAATTFRNAWGVVVLSVAVAMSSMWFL